MTAPTSVTNITGFRTIWTGLSFLNDSPIAGTMIVGSKIEWILAAIDKLSCRVGRQQPGLEQLAGVHEEVFNDRSQDQRGHKGERAHEEHGADDQTGKQRA